LFKRNDISEEFEIGPASSTNADQNLQILTIQGWLFPGKNLFLPEMVKTW